MGECGCTGCSAPLGKMKGPDDLWYILLSYPGCAYCSAPSGLDVIRASSQEAEEYFPRASEMEWFGWGPESQVSSFPIVSEEQLRRPIQTWLKDIHENSPECMHDSCGREVLAEEMAPEFIRYARLHRPSEESGDANRGSGGE